MITGQPKEVEKQRLTPGGKVKRRILGEEIVKAIRFPVMSQKEFASVVVDCEILTKTEIGFMMKHYGGVGLESSLLFMHSPRQHGTGPLHRVYRSAMHNGTDWQCKLRVSGKMPSVLVSVKLSRYKECSILVVKVVNTQFP